MAAFGIAGTPTGAPSPLGRFADPVTAIVSVVVIVFALLSHVHAFAWQPDSFIDYVAILAIGVLYGTSRGVQIGQSANSADLASRGNLNTSLALAAHERLDKMGAPAAPLNHSGLEIGVAPADAPTSTRAAKHG